MDVHRVYYFAIAAVAALLTMSLLISYTQPNTITTKSTDPVTFTTYTIPINGSPVYAVYDPQNGYIYILSRQSNATFGMSYSVVTIISNTTILKSVVVGGSITKGIAAKPTYALYDPANGYVYVFNFLYSTTYLCGFEGSAVVFSGLNIVANITDLVDPYYAIYNPSNGYVYVLNAQGFFYYIIVINGTQSLTNTSLPLKSYLFPYYAVYNPSNGFVYVLGEKGIMVFNGLNIVANLSIPFSTYAVYDPANRYVYAFAGDIYVISGTEVVGNITGVSCPAYGYPVYPVYLQQPAVYNPSNGFIYASCNGSILVVFGTQPVTELNLNSNFIIYDPVNGYVYALNNVYNVVYVISGTQVIATIPVGSDPTYAIYNPSNGYVYVLNYGSNTTTVISGTQVIATVPVGGNPDYAIYDPQNGYVYVLNSGTDSVTVIEQSPFQSYNVTFMEEGLPPGTEWSVTFNGITKSSTSSNITFYDIPPGTYTFTVNSPQGYAASPSSGVVNVSGNALVNITFIPQSQTNLTAVVIMNLLNGQTNWYVPHVYQGDNMSEPTNAWPVYYGPNNASQYWGSSNTQPVLELVPSQRGSAGVMSWQEYYVNDRNVTITLIGTYASGSSPPADGFEVYLFITPNGWGISPQYNYSVPYDVFNPFINTEVSPIRGDIILPQSTTQYIMVQWDPFWQYGYSQGGATGQWNVWVVSTNSSGFTITPSPSPSLGSPYSGWDGVGNGYFQPNPGDIIAVTVTYDPTTNTLTGTAEDLNTGQSANFTLNLNGYFNPPTSGYYVFGVGADTGKAYANWGLLYVNYTQPTPSALKVYNVTFVESGLSNGTLWSITFNGVTKSSTSNTITFTVFPGMYGYVVNPVPGYNATPANGTLIVNSNIMVHITFKQIYSIIVNVYNVNHEPASAVPGVVYGVLYGLNGRLVAMSYMNSNSQLVFNVPPGTYTLYVYHYPNLGLNYTEYWGSMQLTVTGNEELSFTRNTPWIEDVKTVASGSSYQVQVTVNNPLNTAVQDKVVIYASQTQSPNNAIELTQSVTLNPGLNTINLPFTPPSQGSWYVYVALEANINQPKGMPIVTDQWNWTQIISSTGTGVLEILSYSYFSPEEFDGYPVEGVPFYLYITVKNIGNLPVTINGISYTSSPAYDAAGNMPELIILQGPGNVVIEPGQSVTLTYLVEARWHYAPKPSYWSGLIQSMVNAAISLIPVISSTNTISSIMDQLSPKYATIFEHIIEGEILMLKGVSYANIIKSTAVFAIMLINKKITPWVNFTLWFSGVPKVGEDVHVKVIAPRQKFVETIQWASWLIAGTGISTALNIIGSALIASPVGAVFIGLSAALVPSINYAFEKLLYDPSMNFTSIVSPAPIPSVLLNLPNSTAKEALIYEYEYMAYVNASVESMLRAYGALEANSTYYAMLQLHYAEEYANNASYYFHLLNETLLILLNQTLPYVNETTFYEGQELLKTNASVVSNITSILKAMGVYQYINWTQLETMSYQPINESQVISALSSLPDLGQILAQDSVVEMDYIKNITQTPIKKYTVTFIEFGLPSGVEWGVRIIYINGTSKSWNSVSNVISVNLGEGNYTFVVVPPVGLIANVSGGVIELMGNKTMYIKFEPVSNIVLVLNITGFTSNELSVVVGILNETSNQYAYEVSFSVPGQNYEYHYNYVYPQVSDIVDIVINASIKGLGCSSSALYFPLVIYYCKPDVDVQSVPENHVVNASEIRVGVLPMPMFVYVYYGGRSFFMPATSLLSGHIVLAGLGVHGSFVTAALLSLVYLVVIIVAALLALFLVIRRKPSGLSPEEAGRLTDVFAV